MWRLERNAFIKDNLLVEESLFTSANGYLGVRGCFEEGYGLPDISSIRGSYINGLYDRVPITHAESAFGFPHIGDKQPRILDTQQCEVYLDGEKVLLSTEQFSNYSRTLDYKTGVSMRTFDFYTSNGKRAKLSFERLASFWIKNHFLYRISVEYDGLIQLGVFVDAGIENFTDKDDPRVATSHAKLMQCKELKFEGNRVSCLMETSSSKIAQATVVDYRVTGTDNYQITHTRIDNQIMTAIKANSSIVLEKVCTYTDQLRFENCYESAILLADKAVNYSFDTFLLHQAAYLDAFWEHSDIMIEGNAKHQSAIRFMLFQLLQSTGSDEFSNVSAKGLSGEGYEGHYFWDTEIYILPLLQMTEPVLAKNLLTYRYHILPFAKQRAFELGHKKGAAYPWRTISGIECSGYFPAGTAQYHINADIAYAFIQYYLFNNDIDFLAEMGAEVIYETARIWLEIGNYHDGVFMINSVTGPDEYTAIVNNNYYTNAMAKYHLHWAEAFYRILSASDKPDIVAMHTRLCERIGLDEHEILAMRDVSEAMFLPFDATHMINPQDDAFLQKPIWPFEDSKYPLLLYYHPLTIYRHQVLKQADTVLAHFLLEAYTTETVIKNSYHYYEALTTHDSSLSACVHGIMASRIGETDKAFHYFEESIELDLENTHGNTKDGLHMANIAGTALSVISGFSGFRISETGISFRPECPSQWQSYQYRIRYRDREIEVTVGAKTTIRLLSGMPFDLKVWDLNYTLVDVLVFSNDRRCLL